MFPSSRLNPTANIRSFPTIYIDPGQTFALTCLNPTANIRSFPTLTTASSNFRPSLSCVSIPPQTSGLFQLNMRKKPGVPQPKMSQSHRKHQVFSNFESRFGVTPPAPSRLNPTANIRSFPTPPRLAHPTLCSRSLNPTANIRSFPTATSPGTSRFETRLSQSHRKHQVFSNAIGVIAMGAIGATVSIPPQTSGLFQPREQELMGASAKSGLNPTANIRSFPTM